MNIMAKIAPIRYCCDAGKYSINDAWFTNINAVKTATHKPAIIKRKPNNDKPLLNYCTSPSGQFFWFCNSASFIQHI